MAFPSNPSVGDQYTLGSKIFKWTGTFWSRITTTVAANVITSNNILDGTIELADLSSNVTSIYPSNSYVNTRLTSKANISDLTTDNITELSNLYFTNTRSIGAFTAGNGIDIASNGLITGAAQYGDQNAYANTILLGYTTNVYINDRLLTKANVNDLTSANVSELNNLYYTNARVYANVLELDYSTNTYVNTRLSTKANTSDLTTDNVTELNNLYFTNTRSIGSLTAGTGISIESNGRITGSIQYSNSDVQLYLGNVSGNIVPSANEEYSLGSSDRKWKDLFLSGNTIVLGQTKLQSSGDGSLAIRSTNVEITNQISFSSNGYIASTAGPVQAAGAIVPKIANIQITDSSYNILDDTAADSEGYVIINGSFFENGSTVIIGTATATPITYVSSSLLRAKLPVLSPGTYPVYVINSDGATATKINALNISGMPTWNTASGNIEAVYESIPLSVTVNATSDSNITYSLLSGNLPSGATLNSNTGVISAANAELTNSNITYSFTLNATDQQLQNTTRSFTTTVLTDNVIWNTPNVNLNINQSNGSSFSYVLSANSYSGRSISFSSGSLHPGLSITGNIISGNFASVSNTTSVITANSNITNKSNNFVFNFYIGSSLFTAQYLVVAGGGAGGYNSAGGGGAGGFLLGNANVGAGCTLTVVVGAGGARPASPGNRIFPAPNGSNSCLGSSIISIGGGGGGGDGNEAGQPCGFIGAPGGSGGGGDGTAASAPVGGGSGTPGQGNPGGSGTLSSGYTGGGGGGAGGPGGNSTGSGGGGGGPGCTTNICGSPTAYAGGGGAGTFSGSYAGGGCGGGGSGASRNSNPGTGSNGGGSAGSTNTGGGGGGGGENSGGGLQGGAGGSGIVIVRYLDSNPNASSVSGAEPLTCSGGFKIYKFLGSGSITF